eukprot:CAMPEP_0183360654 /NCGR_PEP_ID=MMETSP0164_2-20130417/55824_1 /TAXON_ID=221442 /ORGANISM="Coccolithus pelagicus ssp braarudi, Strain PLY182g" /LENGTH=79 /DNA_ID=CAMNT_0025535069 /DNA_START=355 /DNA_END=594 /DNA_ORIENTATION=+
MHLPRALAVIVVCADSNLRRFVQEGNGFVLQRYPPHEMEAIYTNDNQNRRAQKVHRHIASVKLVGPDEDSEGNDVAEDA